MAKSTIEWTESTWNPVTGCTKISPGCKNCYAERLAHRLKAMGQPNYKNGFDLTLQENQLEKPLKWKSPQMIFVNSMSDLFHKDVPLSFIRRTFEVMAQASWHDFQILTKRSGRLSQIASSIDWPTNVWMGVSVEREDYRHRIEDLRKVPAEIRFLSLEPLLGPLGELDLDGIHWVIVGGESGPGSRPIEECWVTEIQEQCEAQRVPFFFKQWGGVNKKRSGRTLRGKTWDDLPSAYLERQELAASR